MSCVLYHICAPKDERDLSKGYVGITDDFNQRMDKHFSGHGSIVVKRAYKKYGELSYSIVFTGPREVMLIFEKLLRPTKMAWNLVEGGGSPPNPKGKAWTENQAKTIPLANSGRNNSKWKGYWAIDGVKYESMQKAALALGCAKRTVRNRAFSDKFPNWKFEEVK